MSPGRNDPCPCGSGRKFKHCCGKPDASGNPLLRLLPHGALSAAPTPETWDADVAPIMTSIQTEPTARPAVVLIATPTAMITCDLLTHPPASAAGVGALIRDAVRKRLQAGDAPPAILRVRHPQVAACLESELAALGIAKVESMPRLPNLDELLDGLRRQMTGIDEPTGAMSRPDTWAAWDLPPVQLSALFRAAARYYLSAPWTAFHGGHVVRMQMRSGSVWHASIMGGAAQEYGLVLYESLADLSSLYAAHDPLLAISMQESAVISLAFSERRELHPAMRREVAAAKHPVVSPKAYPTLWTHNTIGGGLSDTYLQDLIDALDVLAEFSGTDEAQRASGMGLGELISWIHEGSGTSLIVLDPFGDPPPLWSVPGKLSTSLPEGPAATPRAWELGTSPEQRIAKDMEILDRYLAAERKGGAPESRIRGDDHSIATFLEMVNGYMVVPLAGCTELDLRTFLYDLYPRRGGHHASVARTMRASLRRFFEYVAEHEGISFPWARRILRDQQSFDERCRSAPREYWPDAEVYAWRGKLDADLDVRVMLPGLALAGVGAWGETMGIEESLLQWQLGREWQIWRDALILGGTTSPEDVRRALEARQAVWEGTPQKELNGKSPAAAIKAERRRQSRPTGR